VDWLLIELRDKQDSTSILSTVVGLLQRDGDVVDLDGVSPIHVGSSVDEAFVVVRHRNHLGIMSKQAILFSGHTQLVDFSDSGFGTYGTNAQNFQNGKYMMWAGNVVQDDQLKYIGSASDRDAILVGIGGSSPTNTAVAYANEDINMDGLVKYIGSHNDRDIILVNVGGSVPTSVRSEQLP